MCYSPPSAKISVASFRRGRDSAPLKSSRSKSRSTCRLLCSVSPSSMRVRDKFTLAVVWFAMLAPMNALFDASPAVANGCCAIDCVKPS